VLLEFNSPREIFSYKTLSNKGITRQKTIKCFSAKVKNVHLRFLFTHHSDYDVKAKENIQ